MIALLVLQTIVSIVAKDALVDAYVEARDIDMVTELGRAFAEEGAPAFVPIALGSLVIFGGLLALCAIFLQRGANWARIVVTIVAALNVLGLVVVVFQVSPIWWKLFGVLSALLAIALLVLLYRSDSNAFFRRRGGPATAH